MRKGQRAEVAFGAREVWKAERFAGAQLLRRGACSKECLEVDEAEYDDGSAAIADRVEQSTKLFLEEGGELIGDRVQGCVMALRRSPTQSRLLWPHPDQYEFGHAIGDQLIDLVRQVPTRKQPLAERALRARVHSAPTVA